MAEGTPVRLYLGQPPITTAAALFTAKEVTVVTNLHVANVTATAALATLYLVPKGGSPSAANQITGAVAATGQSFAASVTTEVLAASSMGAIVMNPGDAIYGIQFTSAALTVAISGQNYANA